MTVRKHNWLLTAIAAVVLVSVAFLAQGCGKEEHSGGGTPAVTPTPAATNTPAANQPAANQPAANQPPKNDHPKDHPDKAS